jgi:para-aminobenzoate synthetase / 4-amino-4-deoxychorismate lyase
MSVNDRQLKQARRYRIMRKSVRCSPELAPDVCDVMLNSDRQPYVHFDFPPEPGAEICPISFRCPVAVAAAYHIDAVLPTLRRVQEAVDGGLYAAGYVAYEAAPAFDAAMEVPPASPLPLVWFGLFAAPVACERAEGNGEFVLSAWEPAIAEARYTDDITAIRAGIADGDFYQVNHTLRLRARFSGDDVAWYHRLRRSQRAAFSAYLDLGRYRILSVSPELFFRRDGDGIVTCPMKGTMPRGRWAEEDSARAQALATSEKDRAENIMIVDLLRNDLGRIACIGSVQAGPLFTVERYPTLLQMTSTVEATLPPHTTLADLFTALFPCGSVTGAPKISAMRRIAALETEPRQVYCGAIGYLVPGGPTVFNVAIRTVLLDTEAGTAEYGVGSGITWDSTAAGEYEESQLKAAVLETNWPDFDLLETLRLERGEYALLERHIARVSASADYFGVPLSPQDVRTALTDYALQLNLLDLDLGLDASPWRVRLLVSPQGAIRLEHAALSPPRRLPLRAAFAMTLVSRHDRLLYHKTTHRVMYERCRAEQPEMDETLLWNEEGELTEFTTGNLVVELEGRRWTPPLDCGLLAGTLRAELLARGEIEERVLTPADLERATSIWLINSVRDPIPVQIVY